MAVAVLPPRSFHRMKVRDLPEILQIEQSAYRQCWTEQIFRDCLKVGYDGWVLMEGREIVGYGIVALAVGEAHLLNLCVSPPHQGRGFGRALLDYLIDWSIQCGAGVMFLEVRVSNTRAQSLYRSCGFRLIGERPGYYPAEPPLIREDAWVFRLDLS